MRLLATQEEREACDCKCMNFGECDRIFRGCLCGCDNDYIFTQWFEESLWIKFPQIFKLFEEF